jgi:hypothetical protein
MNRWTMGTLAIGMLAAAVLAWQPQRPLFAQRTPVAPPSSAAAAPAALTGSELIVVPTPVTDGKTQVLTVIDPRQQAMCVYHIDLASGKIALLSARTIRWDLQVTALNNEALLPQDIRSMLEQK